MRCAVDVNGWCTVDQAGRRHPVGRVLRHYTPLGTSGFLAGLVSNHCQCWAGVRDTAVRIAVLGMLEEGDAATDQRDSRGRGCGAPVCHRCGGFLRRAPLILFASARAFQYPNDWGDAGFAG